MADLVLVCTKDRRTDGGPADLRTACLRLTPEGPTVPEPLLTGSADLSAALTQAGQGAHIHSAKHEGALSVGCLIGHHALASWHGVGSEHPDGNYAIARWNDRTLELLTDVCGSRTLWYGLLPRLFLASTSQRALVALLHDFQPSSEAASWMLSAGTLGPEVSWDNRLRAVPPDTRLVLDRSSWTITEHTTTARFEPVHDSRQGHVGRLSRAILDTCHHLALNVEQWMLPLSGGRDSRVLLGALSAAGLKPRCVTWTTAESLKNPLSDAAIACRVARRFGAAHQLMYLDKSHVDVETVLSRFVAANEGRNDEIVAYADGMAMWRELREAGVAGVIRGDESYGSFWRPPAPEDSRRENGIVTLADFPADHLLHSLSLAPQRWPRRLEIREGEDPLYYRERMVQQSYIPLILAGLSQIKARYVEVANPHLSRRVISAVRGLPPHLIRGGTAYQDIVAAQTPGIPLARYSSTPDLAGLCESPDFLRLIIDEVMDTRMDRVLTDHARHELLVALAAGTSGGPLNLRSLLRKASVALPVRLRVRVAPRWRGPDPLPPALIALRALIASRTIALLSEDAESARTAAV